MEEFGTEYPELSLWKMLWSMKAGYIIAFALFLASIILVMIFKDRLARRRPLLNLFRYGILGVSFVYAGLILKAQPTTTNIIIMINGLRELQFPIGLYLLEPFIFLSFAFIGLTLLLWGRGVFCGWLCPYGAMLELFNRLYERLFPKFRFNLPERVHWKLLYLKYFIFLVILAASFYSFILSEYLTEVEPFRTFVLRLKREWYFLAYFMILTVGSLVIYRAFCRYLCPLGAVLAIPSLSKKIPLIKLKRYDLCGKCTICERSCRPQAIMANGLIDSRECLSCLDCQINFWDEDLCPILIQQKKKEEREKSVRNHREAMVATAIFLLLFSVSPGSSISHAKTVVVGMDYPTINEALKMAKDGDMITVKGGEYRERLRIEKAVHLYGVDHPVILGQEGYVIEIARPGVTIEGFTIMHENPYPDMKSAGIYISKGSDGAVVRHNYLHGIMHGIWSVGAGGIQIENNVIEGNAELDRNSRGNGIYLTDSQGAVIHGNKIRHARDGIYIEVSHDGKFTENEVKNSRYAVHTMWVDRALFSKNQVSQNLVGIAIMYSKQSMITDNIAAGNQTHGLLLTQVTRSIIRGNIITGNTKGIHLHNSILNTLASNLVMNNSLGLHSLGGSEENTINGNSFISNEVQVKFVAGRDQQWDRNYWSDYLGWDMNGDRIGDLPYKSNTVVDHILWRYPAAKLLYASASFQFLWLLEKQFPLLNVPKVLDTEPSMAPLHTEWKRLMTQYPYPPEKYYGEIEKLHIAH